MEPVVDGHGHGTLNYVISTAVPPVASKKEPKRRVKGLLLTDTLGKGTFGYVKLGLKESTGQQFALKFLMKNNKRFKIDQIRTEIECMKRIKHKHVVHLLHADYDCKYPNQQGGVDDTVLMVLEYAPGGDLYDILFYSGKLDERVTKTYFLQLAQGVEALHKVGVTHRDLKRTTSFWITNSVSRLLTLGYHTFSRARTSKPTE